MPLDFIKFAFSSGELSEELHGRGDLEGFAFGFRKGTNVMVDWRGGLRSRPGTLMCEPLFEDAKHPGVRLSTFSFNTDPEDNYLLIWKHERLFFVQAGRYLWNNFPKLHGRQLLDGFSVGDIVLVFERRANDLGNYLFTGKVRDASSVHVPYRDNHIVLTEARHLAVKAYSVITPYQGQDVHDIKFDQFRDDTIITHREYRPRLLRRTPVGDASVFTLQSINFLGSRHVENKAVTVTDRTNKFASNTGGFQWTVAVVDEAGVEYPLNYNDGDLVTGLDIGKKFASLAWTAALDVEFYRIYASQFKPDFNEDLDMDAGEVDNVPTFPVFSPQNGRVGQAFSVTLPIATGGDAPLTYVLTGGVPGLSLANGVLSGSPTQAGQYQLEYEVTDADGDSDTVSFNVVIAVAGGVVNAPGPVSNLRSTAQTSRTLSLAVNAPTTGGMPSVYRWKYSTNSSITDDDPEVTSSGPTVTIEDLNPSTSYWVTCRPENTGGQGIYLPAIIVATRSGMPTRNNTKDISLGSGLFSGGDINGDYLTFLRGATLQAWHKDTRVRTVSKDIRLNVALLNANNTNGICLTADAYYLSAINRQGTFGLIVSANRNTNALISFLSLGGFTGALTCSDTKLWLINESRTYMEFDLQSDNTFPRVAPSQITLANAGGGTVHGAVYGNDTIWTTHTGGAKAYSSTSKARRSTLDIVGTARKRYRGGIYHDNTIWLVNDTDDIAEAWDF